jgi:hypothetical protein
MGFIPAFANVHCFCTVVSNLDALATVVISQDIGSNVRGYFRIGRTDIEVADRTGGRYLQAEWLAIALKSRLLANRFS